MKYIGAHVSAAGGVQNAPLNARKIGANAFALFTKNQRQWKTKPLGEEEIRQFKANLAEAGINREHVLPHDSYLINLGSPEKQKRERAVAAFIVEAQRAEQLDIPLLNFHPGSHLQKISEEECLQLIAEGMNAALAETDFIRLVVENTAGQGSAVGYSFEHLARLIELSDRPERVGVCIDTCHAFAAGYDMRNEEAYTRTTGEFARIVGFDKLMGVHLNDAKSEFASRVDRHRPLGEGHLGREAFRLMMRDERFDDIPLILETPEPERWPQEIELLRGMQAAGEKQGN
jgi:deoxyribonuclease-4